MTNLIDFVNENVEAIIATIEKHPNKDKFATTLEWANKMPEAVAQKIAIAKEHGKQEDRTEKSAVQRGVESAIKYAAKPKKEHNPMQHLQVIANHLNLK